MTLSPVFPPLRKEDITIAKNFFLFSLAKTLPDQNISCFQGLKSGDGKNLGLEAPPVKSLNNAPFRSKEVAILEAITSSSSFISS